MTLTRFHIPGALLLVALFVACDRPAPLARVVLAAIGSTAAAPLVREEHHVAVVAERR